jgi:hypothetical protein
MIVKGDGTEGDSGMEEFVMEEEFGYWNVIEIRCHPRAEEDSAGAVHDMVFLKNGYTLKRIQCSGLAVCLPDISARLRSIDWITSGVIGP